MRGDRAQSRRTLIAVVVAVVVVAMAPGVEVVVQLGVVFAISKNVNRLL